MTAHTLSLREAATACDTTTRALQRRIDRGTLRSVKVNERRRVPVSELIRVGLLDTADTGRATIVAETGQVAPTNHARADTDMRAGLDARTLLERLLDQERRYAGLAVRSEMAEDRLRVEVERGRLAEERAAQAGAEAERLRQALSEASERVRGLEQATTHAAALSAAETPPARSWAFWRRATP